MLNILKNYMVYMRIYHSYQKECKMQEWKNGKCKNGKCKKLVCNLYDKKNHVVHIRSLKQALNHGLILKKVHRIIQLSQEAWFKPYIDMNTELRKQAKNGFEKNFFKLMNNAEFGKTMENVR